MKLLLLDKDGTIVRSKSGKTFVQDPFDQVLIPGVENAINQARKLGWAIALVSNQGGVSSGYKTLEDTKKEMSFAMQLADITHGFFCPDMDGSTCVYLWHVGGEAIATTYTQQPEQASFRKPAPGMLLLAQSEWMSSLSMQPPLMVGDRPEDEQAAQAAGFEFLWAGEWIKTID